MAPRVLKDVLERFPALSHLDGTARHQSVGPLSEPLAVTVAPAGEILQRFQLSCRSHDRWLNPLVDWFASIVTHVLRYWYKRVCKPQKDAETYLS